MSKFDSLVRLPAELCDEIVVPILKVAFVIYAITLNFESLFFLIPRHHGTRSVCFIYKKVRYKFFMRHLLYV